MSAVVVELSVGERALVNSRWSQSAAYYAERDDRTLRLVENLPSYSTRAVEIHIDPDAVDEPTVQRMALLTANLTARWARRITVVLPHDTPLAPPLQRGHATLSCRIGREMQCADPFGNFTIGPEVGARDALRLFVGPWRRRAAGMAACDYQVFAAGWSALGRRGSDEIGSVDLMPSATIGAAALAACIGVADVFKRAIGHPAGAWLPTFEWDTWSSKLVRDSNSWGGVVQRQVPSALDLGRVLLAGVGAVGSALVYLADLVPGSGHITLLDKDTVDATNLNRSPLFTVFDVIGGIRKTASAREYLQGGSYVADAVHGLWRELAPAIGAQPYDLWISLTNEDGAWAEQPFQLPPVVLHGTTTSGWGFGLGRHIPRREDCTLCRMPRPHEEFRGPCAEGVVAKFPSGQEARASLPFLSAAAAALILSACTQLAVGGPEVAASPNEVSADLGSGLPTVLALKRLSSLGCRGCRALMSEEWQRRGGRGKFARYSRNPQ